MKTITLSAGLVAITAGETAAYLTDMNMSRATKVMHMTPIPRATETVETAEYDPRITTPDPWQCVNDNVTQYFDVPKPTSALSEALISYGQSLLEPCAATATDRGCTITDDKVWCAFATAAPTSVLADYSSYGSAAASFWQAHSESIADVSTRCPQWWARPSYGDHAWLNQTIIHGECYIAANESDAGSLGLSSAMRLTPTGSVSAGTVSTSSSSASSTTASNGQNQTSVALGQAQSIDSFVLASFGIVAVMIVV
ncbi:hypothetical protein E8E14_014438 [Neopestalotiopsis sp. 37M]|nr:hypothetical protein E8E14_014438 [Neopestalotiopsis sp. 37M]